MPDDRQVDQRVLPRKIRSLLISIFAALVVVTGTTALAPDTQAATRRVVIVVGPVSGKTAEYRESARKFAAQARGYGAAVTELYSPNATWARVSKAAAGANVVIYLGHGNGWPSPYPPFSALSKDGMGLNATAGNGNSNVKYYGEYYMARLKLAANAVVMMTRLCYASGNSEWGRPNPTKATAIKRVDNYGYGFIKGGAQAVFASAITSPGYVLRGLFKGAASMTMNALFWTDPYRTRTYRFSFTSTRIPGVTARMDPRSPGVYYRSVIGRMATTVGDWRAGT